MQRRGEERNNERGLDEEGAPIPSHKRRVRLFPRVTRRRKEKLGIHDPFSTQRDQEG